jgi:AhpD family alkylhydroperoxidase
VSARIQPGSRADIGPINGLVSAVAARRFGGRPPNIFTTLGRHRRLFRPWLRFAARLMPFGTLPRKDTELVILRVAANCHCAYERDHHEHMAKAVGLTEAEIAGTLQGPEAPGWTPRQQTILRAVDELHATRDLSDDAWAGLRREMPKDRHAIEFLMLVGHYEMLAMTLNSLRVERDPH